MKKNNGYVALISTIIIAFVLMTIVISVSTSTLSKLPMITKTRESNEIRQLLNSCVEESLLRLNEKEELQAAIILNENICSTSLISHLNENWEYDVNISKNSYIYSARVKARRLDKVYLDSLTFNHE